MSHFTVLELEVKDRDALVAALEACGYQGRVEVHGTPVPLIGYDDKPRELDGRAVTAEIVIRRQHLWQAANDIGFARQADGRYVAYISEYDRGVQPSWHLRVVQEYGVAKASATLRKQGWTVQVARYGATVKVHGVRYA